MQQRRSDYDVTNRVKTAAAATVAAAVRRIYLDLYRKADVATLGRAFVDFAALYAGEHPGYNPCDTGYHDTQHVLDVTLAMARLLTATSEGEASRWTRASSAWASSWPQLLRGGRRAEHQLCAQGWRAGRHATAPPAAAGPRPRAAAAAVDLDEVYKNNLEPPINADERR